MQPFISWLEAVGLSWGAPGLLLISYIDASFFSLPQVNDLLIFWLTLRQPAMMPVYATMATLGSVAGCWTIYALAKKGGEAFVRKRVHERHVERGLALFRRWGLLAILIPSMLPPPTPFKLFILLAGVAGVSTAKLVAAVAIGRGLRYFAVGLLTLYYGEAALLYLAKHATRVGVVIVVLLVAGALLWWWWTKLARREGTL
ncbi:MAG: VTT domain-containing protein [Vicinamibacteraceae bacterium]|nr:VTT domain-containing protein [Vicinamibacteraceae bacterium]